LYGGWFHQHVVDVGYLHKVVVHKETSEVAHEEKHMWRREREVARLSRII